MLTMDCEVSQLRNGDLGAWNEFAREQDTTTIFHTTEWKNVLEQTFNHEPEYLVVKNPHGEIVGISPAFSVKTLLGKAIVSMPFFEYGGPCVRKGFEGFIYAISKYYKDKVEDDGIDYVELRISPGEKNEDLMKNGFSRQLKAYGFHINVKDMDFEKDIWRGLYTKKSRVRNSVRKAKKKGVRVKEDDDMGAYYRLYLKTMSKLGTPPHPRELFDNINKHIAPYSRFTFAYLSKKPIAAMMSLCYNKRDLMVGLVSDPAYYDLHANDLMYNEQIE